VTGAHLTQEGEETERERKRGRGGGGAHFNGLGSVEKKGGSGPKWCHAAGRWG
jgi:hypothetical protein